MTGQNITQYKNCYILEANTHKTVGKQASTIFVVFFSKETIKSPVLCCLSDTWTRSHFFVVTSDAEL